MAKRVCDRDSGRLQGSARPQAGIKPQDSAPAESCSASKLERYVAVLPLRRGLALRERRLERAHEVRPCQPGLDHVVDVAALGGGYTDPVEGASQMSEDERVAAGINSSSIHLDMMIGGPEVDVTGVRANRTTEPIIEQGVWVLPVGEAVSS